MVIDALRDIRFNDGRGYFFLYETNGTVIMLPTLTHLEGKNLWDTQDVKGSYIIRQVSNIATKQGEGFLTWWYNKPTINEVEKSFEKIGYVKHFKPYNWFVGTGEYIEDFEFDLKARLLRHIKNISFSNNGYIFIMDNHGNYLNHYIEEYIGTNIFDSEDANIRSVGKDVINISKSGEGFLSYTGAIQPSTGLSAEKLSFVKGYSDWEWVIGTGVYINDLNETIRFKQTSLIEENKKQRFQVLLIGLFISIPVFILSLLLSNQIRSRFEDYKENVELKSNELINLNKHLEETVNLRTKKLEDTIVDLQNTQEKLIETEKMASMIGLVSGVAHEMNTPFGVVITALSQTEEKLSQLIHLIKDQKLTKKELTNFEEYSKISNELINRNMEKAVNLIDSFKSLSPQMQSEELRSFSINEVVNHVLLANKEFLDHGQIHVTSYIEDGLRVNSYFHMVRNIIHQLVQNSIIHAFDNHEDNRIIITASSAENKLVIEYQDNGIGIDDQNREKVFEPFFTTKRNTNCTGLGMSILYNNVVHQLKGEIEFDLTTAHGVKVIINLPLDENKLS